MPFREVIGIYDNVYLKFIPDILIIFMFFGYLFKNKFKLKFKVYDYFYILSNMFCDFFVRNSILHQSQ